MICLEQRQERRQFSASLISEKRSRFYLISDGDGSVRRVNFIEPPSVVMMIRARRRNEYQLQPTVPYKSE